MSVVKFRDIIFKEYSKPELCMIDINNTMESFSNLKLTDDSLFLDEESYLLLKLTGVLPVTYRGATYNFPIDIYFWKDHPLSPPVVYVRPTNTMVIRENRFVDATGRVYHPYISDWNHPECDTKSLLRHLQAVFGEIPPLYTKKTIENQQPQPNTTAAETLPTTSKGIQQQQLAMPNPQWITTDVAMLQKSSTPQPKPEIVNNKPQVITVHLENRPELDESECDICQDDVAHDNIYRVLSCNCFVCKICFKDHLENQINRLPASQWKCGVCGLPRNEDGWHNKQRRQLITSWRQFIIKECRNENEVLHEKFEEKIGDCEILSTPGAVSCVKCKAIWKEENQNPCKCKKCQTLFCRFCNTMWTKDHQNVSCVEMMKRQLGDQIDIIQCPECRMLTEKVKGNCEHFDCKRCNAQFCPCGVRFFNGKECLVFGERCENLGFHGHHPRTCLTDLRNIDVEKLKLLIIINDVKYTRRGPASRWCNMVVGLNEALCDKPAFEEKLCQSHFKVHLTKIIQDMKLDPLDVLATEDLILYYKRFDLPVPVKKDNKDELYRLNVINDLKAKWNLNDAVPM